MFCQWPLIMILALSFGSCSSLGPNPKPNMSQTGVIKVAENHKYKLDAIFSGSDVQVGDRIVKVIDGVTIRSESTGQEAKYARTDGPSTSDAHAYFTEVWSPNDELLVLPLNRFGGFCIVRASDALDSIQKQRCTDVVRVRTETGTDLWHDFEKWDTNDAFVFKAGLSGDNTRLKYEISSGRLTALDSNYRNEFQGQNSKGKVAITRKP